MVQPLNGLETGLCEKILTLISIYDDIAFIGWICAGSANLLAFLNGQTLPHGALPGIKFLSLIHISEPTRH